MLAKVRLYCALLKCSIRSELNRVVGRSLHLWRLCPVIFASAFRKVQKSIAQRGIFGTAARCGLLPLMCCRTLVRFWTPSRRRYRQTEIDFDRRYYVDTVRDLDAGWIAGIESENWQHGTGYDPAPIRSVTDTLSSLDIRHQDFTFVDFGSGKGRTLFLAAQFPFAAIVGIEFSPRLHAIAERNLATYRNPEQSCTNLRAIFGDAARFPIPEGPAVFFFHHPFDATVFRQVIDNIVASYDQSRRQLIVVYYDPKCIDLFPTSLFHECAKGRERRDGIRSP